MVYQGANRIIRRNLTTMAMHLMHQVHLLG